MRFDKLRVVAWLFIAFAVIGVATTVKAGWNGVAKFDMSIVGLWVGFDLLRLQPSARAWGTRLAGLEIVLLAVSLGIAIWFRVIGAVEFSTNFTVAILLLGVSLGLWGWIFHVLREPSIRARFTHEPEPGRSSRVRGRLLATAVLAAGFMWFVDIFSWKFNGHVRVVREDASHAVVIVRAADGKTWRSALTNSGDFSFSFWQRPASPLNLAVCNTSRHTALDPDRLAWSGFDRMTIHVDRADSYGLCSQ